MLLLLLLEASSFALFDRLLVRHGFRICLKIEVCLIACCQYLFLCLFTVAFERIKGLNLFWCWSPICQVLNLHTKLGKPIPDATSADGSDGVAAAAAESKKVIVPLMQKFVGWLSSLNLFDTNVFYCICCACYYQTSEGMAIEELRWLENEDEVLLDFAFLARSQRSTTGSADGAEAVVDSTLFGRSGNRHFIFRRIS